MALNDTDRRRVLLATVVTVIALPAIWWANRADESVRPNVATVGVEIGDANDGNSNQTSAIDVEPDDDQAPVYLDGPAADALPAVADIAVPATGELAVRQSATYSSDLPAGWCLAKGVNDGERVRVVNLENNRSVTCVVRFAPDGQRDDLIIGRVAFLKLADLTDAPIPVEIRK